MQTTRAWMLALAGSALITACGGGDTSGQSGNASAGEAGGEAAAQAAVPDACTFIPKAELEALVGYELRDGEPQDVPPGESQCDFERPPGMYVTRTFDKPPLPEASGFSSIVVTTYPTTAERFGESRSLMGEGDVAGVGDGAFLIGPNLMHVRAGDRGFSFRVHVNQPETDAGRAALRAAMVAIANAGVAKLRGG